MTQNPTECRLCCCTFPNDAFECFGAPVKPHHTYHTLLPNALIDTWMQAGPTDSTSEVNSRESNLEPLICTQVHSGRSVDTVPQLVSKGVVNWLQQPFFSLTVTLTPTWKVHPVCPDSAKPPKLHGSTCQLDATH